MSWFSWNLLLYYISYSNYKEKTGLSRKKHHWGQASKTSVMARKPFKLKKQGKLCQPCCLKDKDHGRISYPYKARPSITNT
jgi:hypothetical protein